MKTVTSLLILSLIFSTNLLGQDLKLKTKRHYPYVEEYYVLKSDKNIRHGAYTLSGVSGVVFEKGYYKNNLKDSLWIYYTLGQPSRMGNYANGEQIGEWIYYLPNGQKQYIFNHSTKTLIEYDWGQQDKMVQILYNDDWISEEIDNPAIIITAYNLYNEILENMKHPVEAMEQGIKGVVYIEVEISKEGSCVGCRVAKGVAPILDEEALRLCKYFETEWYPAHYKGESVNSKFIFPLRFN